MDARRWLETVRQEFERNRLPPFYVKRLVKELSDHLNDFMEDHMSTDAKDLHGVFERLGEPRHIAHSAVQELRRQRFSGRHPLVAFVLLPIVALPTLWAIAILLMLLTTKLLGLESGGSGLGGPVAEWANLCLPGVLFALKVVPLAACAVIFCRLARRAALGYRWPVVACSILAVVGGLAFFNLVLPSPFEKGRLTLGFAVSNQPSLAQVAQFALPLTICALAVWRQAHQREMHVA